MQLVEARQLAEVVGAAIRVYRKPDRCRVCGETKHVDIPERDHPLDPHTVEQLDRYQRAWEIIA